MNERVTKSFALAANILQIVVVLIGGLFFMFQIKTELAVVQRDIAQQRADIERITDFLGIWHNGNRAFGLDPARKKGDGS